MNDAAATSGRQTYNGTLAGAGGRELQASAAHAGTLAVALYASPPYAMQVPPLAVARLSINLSPASVTGGLDGERPRAFAARRHSMFLMPAGAGAAWRKASSSRHINIYFDPRAFGCDDGPAATPLFNAGLVGAGPLIELLAAELQGSDAFGAEAVDSLARLILVRLARRRAREAEWRDPLTPALHARLTDYIVAHLDQRLLVAELAAVAGLTPNRFAQAFTRSAGEPPHQYVLRLRLERAAQRLRRSRESLADIAAGCGFSSQQHMTQLMRRRLGTTPARMRGDADVRSTNALAG